MLQITADIIHNGFHFLPPNTVIHLHDDHETIMDVNTSKNNSPHIHFKGLVMPGMVNAHCHLELSHLHNQFAKNNGLVDFLLDVIKKRNKTDIADKIKAAFDWDKKMYQSGIVATGDICNTIDTYEVKKNSYIQYYNFIECYGLKAENTNEIINNGNTVLQKLTEQHASSLVLHAPYSIHHALINEIDLASKNKIISIHNQESEAENELFESKSGDFFRLFDFIGSTLDNHLMSGKSSLQTILPLFLHPQNIILVHNTYSSKDDMHYALQSGKKIFWCTCPNANLFIENKLPDLPLWDKMGCKIVIGTDSLASNEDLNIWKEIDTIYKNFPSISLEKMLNWASYEGACALGFQDTLGSIEKGKKPGLVHINHITGQDILLRKPLSDFTSQRIQFT